MKTLFIVLASFFATHAYAQDIKLACGDIVGKQLSLDLNIAHEFTEQEFTDAREMDEQVNVKAYVCIDDENTNSYNKQTGKWHYGTQMQVDASPAWFKASKTGTKINLRFYAPIMPESLHRPEMSPYDQNSLRRSLLSYETTTKTLTWKFRNNTYVFTCEEIK